MMTLIRKDLLPAVLVPTCILAIPAAAMLFKVEGWAWGPADFVLFWALIAGAVLAYKLVARRVAGAAHRVATGIAVATGFVLLWINGAVGLIGSEDNPANLMYAGVLAVGAIGAGLARLKPAGMARALGATALAQFLVPVVALMARPDDFSPGVAQVFALNFSFVLLFSVSALLFRHADRKPGGTDAPATA